MKNNYFDQLFVRKFAQLPGVPYSREGWDEIAGRLDRYERRRRNWVLPVLLPLFGLLAAGNVFWWLQWKEAVAQRKDKDQPITLFQNDTIVQTTVVYRYDTIYQNIKLVHRQAANLAAAAKLPPVQEIVQALSFSESNLSSGATAARKNPDAGFPPAVPGYVKPAQYPDSVQTILQNPETQPVAHHNTAGPEHAVILQNTRDTLAQAAQPETAAVDSLAGQLMETPVPTKKLRSPRFFWARPRLGFSQGWSNPIVQHKNSGYLLGAGIGADVEIANNLRLAVDVHYWQGKLKADEAKALDDIDIPDPGSDYKLEYWEIYRLPSVSYALQLRYQISVKKRWQPWIGLGYQAATLLPFEIEFEFENQLNNIEITLPGKAEARIQLQGILGSLGIERSFGSRFSLSAEGWLVRCIGKNSKILDQQIGLRTRFYYNF